MLLVLWALGVLCGSTLCSNVACFDLEDEFDHDTAQAEMTRQKAFEWGERIPIGVLYRHEQPTYEDGVAARRPGPLAHQKLGLGRETFDELMEEFR
jgi:2-oxoglutarate ferredoxin oxidoreductase subunit beta